jgi:hypothetical protein
MTRGIMSVKAIALIMSFGFGRWEAVEYFRTYMPAF